VSTGVVVVAWGVMIALYRWGQRMSQQSVRVAARKVALEAQARMRAQRAEQERRRSALAVAVVQALAERDAAVVACEQRAGAALAGLTGAEGLAVAEVKAWCGGDLSSREVARLRRVAAGAGAIAPIGPSGGESAGAPGEEGDDLQRNPGRAAQI